MVKHLLARLEAKVWKCCGVEEKTTFTEISALVVDGGRCSNFAPGEKPETTGEAAA